VLKKVTKMKNKGKEVTAGSGRDADVATDGNSRNVFLDEKAADNEEKVNQIDDGDSRDLSDSERFPSGDRLEDAMYDLDDREDGDGDEKFFKDERNSSSARGSGWMYFGILGVMIVAPIVFVSLAIGFYFGRQQHWRALAYARAAPHVTLHKTSPETVDF